MCHSLGWPGQTRLARLVRPGYASQCRVSLRSAVSLLALHQLTSLCFSSSQTVSWFAAQERESSSPGQVLNSVHSGVSPSSFPVEFPLVLGNSRGGHRPDGGLLLSEYSVPLHVPSSFPGLQATTNYGDVSAEVFLSPECVSRAG